MRPRLLVPLLLRPTTEVGALIYAQRKFFPFVTVMGMLAGLFDAVGFGLIVPLLVVIFDQNADAAALGPLAPVATAFMQIEPQARIMTLGLIVLGLVVLKSLLHAANMALIVWLEGRADHATRVALAARLVKSRYELFLVERRADLLKVIESYSYCVGTCAKAIFTMLPAVASLGIFALLLIYIEWHLFVIAVLFGGLIVMIFSRLANRQRVLSQALTPNHSEVIGRNLDLIDAARAIRVFGQQQGELQDYERASMEMTRKLFWLSALGTSIGPLIEIMLILLGVWLVFASLLLDLSLATASTFLLVLVRVQPHAMALIRARSEMMHQTGPLEEVERILSNRETLEPRGGYIAIRLIDRDIAFKDVSYTYPDGTTGIENIDLTLRHGEVSALLGASGAGKSTIVNLLCRLVEPRSGIICIGKTPLRDLNVFSWRARIAVSGQDVPLVRGTAAENIAFGRPSMGRKSIEEAAEAAGATFIFDLPQGLDTPLHEAGMSLSGGQRQRLGLARALLLKPDLLILDEATNAVDALAEDEILELFQRRDFFTTALVISHRRSTLAHCSEGFVLHEGKLAEAGPLEELQYYRSMAGITWS